MIDMTLVRVGGMPIVMGRVYDSALDEGADFGPGWKLTVVEEVRQEGLQLLFTDASNGVHRLDVSGATVTPASPVTAPVVSGSTRTTAGEVGIVVLESADGMLRRFKQDGDVWRLVHVRHGRGWVRLDWRRGSLVKVTSDAGWVRISRRDDGRISSMVDNIGRTVAYSYDSDRRLTGVTDVAGGSWRVAYAGGGRLSSITDPRSKVVIAAAWTDARVRRIRALHETTDFAYAESATTATNLLGWATVYRRADSGITRSITDRTGATTEVAFDASHRPVTVTRDSATVARIGYDEEGRLASVWQPAGETAFTTNNRGEVTVAAGAWTARYRYAERRVVHASDSSGVRDYRYAEDGSLAGATVDGIDTALRTNADGTLGGISRDGRSLATYAYAAGGRVSSIDYGAGRTATFAYDARGLRTSGNYSYGTDVRIEAAISYDAVGNLTRIERGVAGAEATVQTYAVGDYNEVQQVRTGDGLDPDRPDLTLEYDAAGRVRGATLGRRTATVEYDALDRATRLAVDGETVLERDYGPDDEDAAEREDRRTGGVLVAAPLSRVFGTMESIVYARPRSAEFGIVAYSPSRKTFEVRPDALAGDALQLASLHARMVPVGGGEPNPAPYGHDKPSNSLFIPPEFRAVNCQLCTGFIYGVDLYVTPAGTHCPTKYHAVVDGYCHVVTPGDFSPVQFGIPLPWHHSTYFGDGSPVSETTTWNNEVWGSHKYLAAGEYTMSHFVFCSCPSAFAYDSASVTFDVPGGSESCQPPSVRVDSADVVRDEIVVNLQPTGSSGTLGVSLVGSKTHTVSTRVAAGGTHTISFGIGSVPTGNYTGVRATWTVGTNTPSDTRAYRFRVLGNYRHSQYNSPSEDSCTGAPRSSYMTNNQCTFSGTTLKGDFVDKVNLNGSGHSTNHGTIAPEEWCLDNGEHPDDADGRSFRSGHTIMGACGSVGSSTVAVRLGHSYLSCGDSVYIVGVGVKTVTDSCPGCSTAQLDNYTTSTACHGILDLGTFKTIKL